VFIRESHGDTWLASSYRNCVIKEKAHIIYQALNTKIHLFQHTWKS